jgi:ribosomal protein S18 acetylase RimI-like enzyme
MFSYDQRQKQLAAALAKVTLPTGISLRGWTEDDFSAIQQLSSAEGWPTTQDRPEEALSAWQHSWPALVISSEENVVGFLRALTDRQVTTYVADLVIASQYRGRGLGRALLEACHALYPNTRLDLISTEHANPFYKAQGFRYVGEGLRKSY